MNFAILVEFADMKVRVCKGYDEYLKYMYGDYMKLPPIEQQNPKHYRYYINLEERLTVSEVKRRVKNGERSK